MRTYFYHRKTVRRLKKLIHSGLCPQCNSSPPYIDCRVCEGSANYGPEILAATKQDWAANYVFIREIGKP